MNHELSKNYLISDVHNSSLISSPNMLVELVLLLPGVVLDLSSSI